VLAPAQQLETLMEWLTAMADQLPDAEGRSRAQRQEEQEARNASVLTV
jgi:transcription-repair coupling factor (superfamily II helicase)